MNLQIACVVNGNTEYIEMFGNEAFTMDISFAEIQDITKKNSAYSKDLKVPGSKQNNYIFNYFFDINQVPLDFTPTKKFEASILYNGYVITSGYIRLNSVVINKLEKTYNITFYNGIGDVAANIGDKYLYDLDLSHLNHPYSFDCITQSTLDPNLFPLTGSTNYSYQNGKTFFGLFNIGYNYAGSLVGVTATTAVDYTTTPLIQFPPQTGTTLPNNDPRYFNFTGTTKSPVNDFYFKPAIQVKELYEQIFNQAGYTIESNFFDTNYFQKYYIPLKFQNDSVYDVNGFNGCYNFTDNTPKVINSCTVASFPPINPSTSSCNNIGVTVVAEGASPFATFKLNFPAEYKGDYFMTATINVTFTNGCSDAQFDLAGTAFYVRLENIGATPATFTRTYEFNPVLISSEAFNGANNVLYMRARGKFTINSISINLQSRVKFLQSGSTFDYNLEFSNTQYKQLDFITSVNKAFNLVCVPSPVNPNSIRVEPIIDYIGKGKTLDWSDKIDYDSIITVLPTNTLINGSLDFKLNIDQDYPNQQFNGSNNRIFGTTNLQLNQDFKDNNITFNSQFSPSIDLTLNANKDGDITIPTYPSLNVNNVNGTSLLTFKSIKILPKMIFRGPVMPNENWGFNNSDSTEPLQTWFAARYNQQNITEFDRWQSNNRFTTYPFSYTGFSHYINWNSSDNYDPLEYDFPSQQDLYDIYYYDYISDLTSPDNKIMQAKIYLTPYEIANLEFNEKILIKNAYFRINKISGYNLTEPSLCDIELVKLTKSYTPHPVQYYDLISCSGGTNYHTTSDLNYNMYAYVGNYVKLFTGSTTNYTSIGCYEVQLGSPNDNYDYEPVFINSGYTSSGVAVYNNCGCTGKTSFNIVQQEYPIPTPPPVTSPTPTPSPTGTPAVTPTMTPTTTTTMTPTMTQTSTTTPTPTPTNAGDADANAYLEAVVQAGGTGITSTVSAATQTMFVDLKSAGIYTKLNALYPFLGGTAASCKWNALNPVDTNAAFRLTFFGGSSFSQAKGYIGNASNAYADTYWIQTGQTATGNTSIGMFVSVSGTSGFDMGVNSAGQWLALNSSNATNMRGGIETGLVNFTAQTNTQAINFNAISRANNSTVLFVARGGGVQSVASVGTSTLQTASITIGQANLFGSYSNRGWGSVFIGDGLTNTELGNLRDIITTFNTTLGRNI